MTELKGDSTVESLGTYYYHVINWLVSSCAVCCIPLNNNISESTWTS